MMIARRSGMLRVGRNRGPWQSRFVAKKSGSEPQRGVLARVASAVKLRPKKNLVFNQFPKQPGGGATVGGLVALNFGVYGLWTYAALGELDDGAEGSARMDLMRKIFLWRNDSLANGEFWTLVTSSVSHQGWSHLTGNMVFGAYLGLILHEFMGRARFLGLCLAGALGGSLASQLCPAYFSDAVAATSMRERNVLMGAPAGQMGSLGASDVVMALLGATYAIFPRRQIHIFRFLHLLFRKRWPEKFQPTVSALWLLPLYFTADFLAAASPDPNDNVNHHAHIGGFSAGILFHLLVTSRIKAKYFPLAWFEDWRRWYLTAVSLGVVGGGLSLFGSWAAERKTQKALVERLEAVAGGGDERELAPRSNALTRPPDVDDEEEKKTKKGESPFHEFAIRPEALAGPDSKTRELLQCGGNWRLAEEALECSHRRCCARAAGELQFPAGGGASAPLFDCDAKFGALREALLATGGERGLRLVLRKSEATNCVCPPRPARRRTLRPPEATTQLGSLE